MASVTIKISIPNTPLEIGVLVIPGRPDTAASAVENNMV
jgi:hypothetical protein